MFESDQDIPHGRAGRAGVQQVLSGLERCSGIELAGIDVERAIRDFDSGAALEAAEDLVHTGPTGTNVGDILIGIKSTATSVRDAARGRML